ncbi:molybdopterin dinucleotide binding domain-containing protein [Escherichia coli]
MGYPLHLQRQPADADLGRGGPVVWLSEADAKDLGIADNDWIEVFNSNGAHCPCGCQPACSGRDDHDVPRAGTYRSSSVRKLPNSVVVSITRSPVSRRNRRI